MENILIIGASGGIGAALATTAQGNVTALSRAVDGLDVTDPISVDRILGKLDGPFDSIIVAIGVLGTPEKSLSAIDADAMLNVLRVNAVGPALILRHVPRLLAAGGRVAVLSARVGSIGDNAIGGWHSYRASKAALNQIVHGGAIELARTHKGSVCIALQVRFVSPCILAQWRHHLRKTISAVMQRFCRKWLPPIFGASLRD